MRINKYVALASSLSRRAADTAITHGRVTINGRLATLGSNVDNGDKVTLDGSAITPTVKTVLMLNKPPGYVVSRQGQGARTIYDLLPPEHQHLQPVGRLDKDSSGLLLLTNDGNLANQLTHPSHHKTKVYQVTLDQPLEPLHHQMISDHGINLEDGPSQLQLDRLHDGDDTAWQVTMHEGRNRQIRRTFAALGYRITSLHRISFGPYTLDNLATGELLRVATLG